MDYVIFTVPGDPYGKPRPRFTRAGRAYRNKEDTDYEQKVIHNWVMSGHHSFGKDVPLCLEVSAYFRIQKSASKKNVLLMLKGLILPTKKPDFDNIMKAVTDPLNKLCFYDDSQITEVSFKKRYSDNPRVEVRIYERRILPVSEVAAGDGAE